MVKQDEKDRRGKIINKDEGGNIDKRPGKIKEILNKEELPENKRCRSYIK